MNDIEKDLNYLIETAKEAIVILRRNAEYFEAQGKDAKAEREAVRWLNLAIQLVQYNLFGSEGLTKPLQHQEQEREHIGF